MKAMSAVALAIALTTSSLVYAAPSDTPSPAHATVAKGKTVKFSVRNDSGTSFELKLGDQVLAIDAGKTVDLKLPVGTQITMNSSTDKHKAGDLIAEVSTQFANATLAIK